MAKPYLLLKSKIFIDVVIILSWVHHGTNIPRFLLWTVVYNEPNHAHSMTVREVDKVVRIMIFESATWRHPGGRRGAVPEAQTELDKDSVHVSRPHCPYINNSHLFLEKRERKNTSWKKHKNSVLSNIVIHFTVGSWNWGKWEFKRETLWHSWVCLLGLGFTPLMKSFWFNTFVERLLGTIFLCQSLLKLICTSLIHGFFQVMMLSTT